MPSSIIELPRTRSAKTCFPAHRVVGTESVSCTALASYGAPAATTPSNGISMVSANSNVSSAAVAHASSHLSICHPPFDASYLHEEKAKLKVAARVGQNLRCIREPLPSPTRL